jgi:glycerol-3-phosphate dehydrogenase
MENLTSLAGASVVKDIADPQVTHVVVTTRDQRRLQDIRETIKWYALIHPSTHPYTSINYLGLLN